MVNCFSNFEIIKRNIVKKYSLLFTYFSFWWNFCTKIKQWLHIISYNFILDIIFILFIYFIVACEAFKDQCKSHLLWVLVTCLIDFGGGCLVWLHVLWGLVTCLKDLFICLFVYFQRFPILVTHIVGVGCMFEIFFFSYRVFQFWSCICGWWSHVYFSSFVL